MAQRKSGKQQQQTQASGPDAGQPARTGRPAQTKDTTQASGRNPGTPHQRQGNNRPGDADASQQQAQQREERDEQNKRRFVDQSGLEASQLPGGGRDDPDTDFAREAARQLPHQHGGELGEEGGLRGDREINDADKHGGRKRN